MGLFDLFSSSPAPAHTQQPAPAAAPAPTVPDTTVPESPMAKFTELWDPVTANSASPSGPTPLNSDDVAKAMSKADFSSAITPENLSAIAMGGEAAQQAFAQSLNAVAQAVMTRATLVNSKLMDQRVNEAVEAYAAKMPEALRSQTAAAHLKDTIPLYSNPAVRPVVEATQAQLLQKYPNATPAQINSMVQDYLQAMGDYFAPPKPKTQAELNQTDWSKFEL